MGGTTNATDNFKIEPRNDLAEAVAAAQAEGAPTEAEVRASAEAHVHGPGCGHDHSHDHEAGAKHPEGKYLTPDQIPKLDLKASFALNNEGPIWRKTPQELLTNIAFQAASVPQGGIKICFVNNEAYKFLLALRDFQRRFTPSGTSAQQREGVLGLFGSHVIIASDALWEPNDQVTLHKAIYFCDEVLDPSVTELLIETADNAKDGAGHASPESLVPADAAEIAEDVIDKEKGRCINCLDTGLVAGDLDQICHCPAGTDGGKREAAIEKRGADFSEIE